MSVGLIASNVMADEVLIVDGEECLLSSLMANCQSITDDPAAQIAYFGAISKRMEEQSASQQPDAKVVAQSLIPDCRLPGRTARSSFSTTTTISTSAAAMCRPSTCSARSLMPRNYSMSRR